MRTVEQLTEQAHVRGRLPVVRAGWWRDGAWRGFLMVVVVTSVLWCYRFSGPIDLRYDGGVYYVLGTSLAEGNGYRLTNEPGAPQSIQYPPGLPAFVALHERVLGTADPQIVGAWLKRSFFVLHLALAITIWALARSLLGQGAALIASFLALVQLNGILLSNLLFTELPFTLASVSMALILSSDFLRSRPVLRELFGFCAAVVGFALRTAGLALLLAWVGEAVWRRQWSIAATRVVLAALPFFGWQAYVNSVQHSEAYGHVAYAYQRAPYQFYNVSYAENLALVDPFRPELGRGTLKTLAARVATNVAKLPVSLGEAASEVRGFWSGAVKAVFFPGTKRVGWLDALATIPVVPVAIVMLVGGINLARRREGFLVLLVVFSVGLTLVTPWPTQVPRYLSPIGPFLTVMLVIGAAEIFLRLRAMPSRGWRRVGWIVGGVLMGGFVSAHAFAALNSYRSMTRTPPVPVGGEWENRRWFYYDPGWANWDRAVDWIARNSPPDAIVATSVPHLCYLMTDRRSVLPPMEANPAVASDLLRKIPASYVVVDELDFLDISRRYAAPAMVASDDWHVVMRFNKTLIYGRTDIPSPRSEGVKKRPTIGPDPRP